MLGNPCVLYAWCDLKKKISPDTFGWAKVTNGDWYLRGTNKHAFTGPIFLKQICSFVFVLWDVPSFQNIGRRLLVSKTQKGSCMRKNEPGLSNSVFSNVIGMYFLKLVSPETYYKCQLL